ncbi:MAG: YggU family protein [Bryobacteraceae bacterium]|nr:YggU family protein [Bryobacteraceae bacterium]
MDLRVKVIPKSSKSEVIGYLPDGTLKVKIAAAPERGKANAELCALLAKQFGVPRKNVVIVSGETSQHKHVRISR